jgi:hypothetical protein
VCEHAGVFPARSLLLSLAAAALLTGCSSSDTPPLPPGPAPLQRAALDWVERYPSEGPALVFRAERFAVTSSGWQAEIALENDTKTAWQLVEDPTTAFGVMLFTTDDVGEVEARTRDDDLPGLRAAQSFDPSLPTSLPPGGSWRGRISAPGNLAAGLYVRIVFGRLVAVGDAPDGIPAQFSWITDHSYRLRDSD